MAFHYWANQKQTKRTRVFIIEIRISEAHYSEDKNQDPIKRSKMEIFIEGFKKLCEATEMNSVITELSSERYNIFSVVYE